MPAAIAGASQAARQPGSQAARQAGRQAPMLVVVDRTLAAKSGAAVFVCTNGERRCSAATEREGGRERPSTAPSLVSMLEEEEEENYASGFFLASRI